MMIINKYPDVWAGLSLTQPHTIAYEDGTTAPLTTDQIFFNFGKYNGLRLSEVSDMGYLQWLVREGDVWQELAATLRLSELQ